MAGLEWDLILAVAATAWAVCRMMAALMGGRRAIAMAYTGLAAALGLPLLHALSDQQGPSFGQGATLLACSGVFWCLAILSVLNGQRRERRQLRL